MTFLNPWGVLGYPDKVTLKRWLDEIPYGAFRKFVQKYDPRWGREKSPEELAGQKMKTFEVRLIGERQITVAAISTVEAFNAKEAAEIAKLDGSLVWKDSAWGDDCITDVQIDYINEIQH